MEYLAFALALPAALLAFYVALKKTNLVTAAVFIGSPILINTIDVLVQGNLTTEREIAFALWSLAALYVVLHQQINRGR